MIKVTEWIRRGRGLTRVGQDWTRSVVNHTYKQHTKHKCAENKSKEDRRDLALESTEGPLLRIKIRYILSGLKSRPAKKKKKNLNPKDNKQAQKTQSEPITIY